MTTSTTPPLLTPLPPAPLPTDAEAVFDAKAGASLTAQAVMVGEVNTALAWQADSMDASLSYKNAAAESATAAANSASSATASAAAATTNGAAQVALATTQASNAAASSSSAQVSAAAAGAAAGLPSFSGKDAFDVLRINSTKNGVEWGKSGQSIGDLLMTARSPGATYAATNRAIYLQSAYPDLYALIGAKPDVDRSIITFGPINQSFSSDSISYMATADSGSLIIACCTNVDFCYTSSDRGITWIRRPMPSTGSSRYSLGVSNGVFLLTQQSSSTQYWTTTDGITWTSRLFGTTVANPLVSSINGLFVVAQSNTTSVYQTSPDGINWTVRSGMANIGVAAFIPLNGKLIGISSGTSFYMLSSDGINWLSLQAPGQYSSFWYSGGVYYANTNTDPAVLYSTTDITVGILGWTRITGVFPANTATWAFNGAMVSTTDSCIVLATTGNSVAVSSDNGLTWVFRSVPFAFNYPFQFESKFMAFAGTSVANLPYRSYDKTTSFITPKVNIQPAPIVTYIKGKLA
ncbi:hypothetical protein ACCD10_07180 [Pseudomonas sp. Pseusp122]|uniref:hypothetical protein n=1 Tax=unclassified Pseudomonas TaxID=196821 RepID=UPI0039A6DA00